MVQRCVLVACETERMPLLLVHSVVYTCMCNCAVPAYNPFLPATSLSRKRKEERAVAVKSRLINHASLRQDRKAARTGQTRRKHSPARLPRVIPSRSRAYSTVSLSQPLSHSFFFYSTESCSKFSRRIV